MIKYYKFSYHEITRTSIQAIGIFIWKEGSCTWPQNYQNVKPTSYMTVPHNSTMVVLLLADNGTSTSGVIC